MEKIWANMPVDTYAGKAHRFALRLTCAGHRRRSAMRKNGCLWIVFAIIGLVVVFKVWSTYSNRPAALYERWVGGPVPEDVTDLDGDYRFALTESIAWLSFNSTEARIAKIVERNRLHEVIPETPWNDGEGSRRYWIDGKRHGGNWFDSGGLRHFDPVPPDLKVYWRNHDGQNDTYSGWALYFSPKTGAAFWTSISI